MKSNLFNKTKVSLLGLVLLAARLVSGIDLKVGWQVSARSFSAESETLEAESTISPGTVVKVPEKFSQKYRGLDGQQLSENAVMDWLGRSGQLRQFRMAENDIRREYFFPVEIVETPSGKSPKPGSTVYIPIRYLVRKGGLQLVVDEKSPVVKKDIESKSQIGGPAADADPVTLLNQALKPALNRVEKQAIRAIDTRLGPNNTEQKFERSCLLGFADFQKELRAVAVTRRIPEEILLSIMNMESGGRCFAVRREYNGSRSIGLFQVNTESTTVDTCSEEQISKLKKRPSLKVLRGNDLRCLQNPLVNLEVAAKILRNKYSIVNERKQPEALAWHEMSAEARDDWRKAVAGYNGGQAYILQSAEDIRSFNRTHGANLNPEQWENHRKFLFRRIIERDFGTEFFDKEMRFKRGLRAIYQNMIYVEAIAGREVTQVFAQDTLVARWLMRLYLGDTAHYINFLRGEGI